MHICCEKDFLKKNSVFLLTQRKGVQYFFVLVSGCYDTGVFSPFMNTCMYLCSETLRGYSDSISGRTPPSCGQSSEPRQAAWSSTGTAWEPEPGSSLWTRVTPGRRAEPQCWIHLCTTHESPHKHAHTHTGRSKRNKNRIKKWMQLCLARSVGSLKSWMRFNKSYKNRWSFRAANAP